MIAAGVRKPLFVLLAAVLVCSAAGVEEPKAVDPERLLSEARDQFACADVDADATVTLAEFLALYPAAEQTDRKRQFAEFDRNSDGKLSRGEFANLFLPYEQRGPVRDPIVELERRALAKWQAIFDAAEGGNAVTPANWPAEQISRQLPALADVTFEQWDRNGDGQVDRDEGRWLMEVAYGLTQLDGRPIRTPQGRVFSWNYFRAIDQNGDGVLSRQEFIAHHNGGTDREKNAALFEMYDADADGRLTAEETLIPYWHDTLAEFFSYDRDRDGSLSTDEFMKIGWATEIARRTARAFDDDHDGKISFEDFRRTTFANQASGWGKPRRDVDHDGRLSFQEFYIEKPPLLIAQSRYFFDHFDLNKDGSLSAAEFDFEATFATNDADHDGHLTLQEFLASVDELQRADRARRFLVFDFDGNGKLDAREYDTFAAPIDKRGEVPDPIVEFEQAALDKWAALFSAADQDGNGSLSPAEWPQAKLAAKIPEVADAFFTLWDHDLDGQVTAEEGRRFLEIAYGLTQLDGRPLRTPTGRVFSWYYFRRMDNNHDGVIAREELLSRHFSGREKSAEVFTALDADRDDQLTDRETWNFLWHDTISGFLDWDRDGDGYLTTRELLTLGWDAEATNIERRCVRAFDDDHDGKLSFREFRRTTFANQASEWTAYRQDADHDGRLSFQEFYQEKPPLLIAQSRYFFDRFDLNKDGFLSLVEFDFDGSGERAQLHVYIDPLEQRLPLEVQFVKRVCELSDEQTAALEASAWSAFDRVAEKIAAWVLRNQRPNQARMAMPVNVRAVPAGLEQEPITAPHQALRRELAVTLKSKWPDAWQKLDAERQRLDARRKEASILAQVAALDEALLLSTRQRKDLCDLLAGPLADAWWLPGLSGSALTSGQQLQAALAGNSLGAFSIPEASLAKCLTQVQLDTLNQLNQPRREEWLMVEQPAPQAGAMAPPGMAAPQRMQRRVVRRGPSPEDQQQRLLGYVASLINDIDAACSLSPPQREKLLLAGTLDINAWKEQLPPPEKPPEGQKVVIQNVQVDGPAPPLPIAIFSALGSYFQKALQSRLLDEQKHKLSAAERERLAFQQKSLVAAVVASYERAAGLTSQQCEKLSSSLGDALGRPDAEVAGDWRLKCLRRLEQVPVESLDGICLDFQRPAMGQHRSQLLNVPVQVEAGRPMPLGNVPVQVEVLLPLRIAAPPRAAPGAARPAVNDVD
jgi:Ca2+-binding EF-hand superfamily protein